MSLVGSCAEQQAFAEPGGMQGIALAEKRVRPWCVSALEVAEVKDGISVPNRDVDAQLERVREVLRALTRFAMHRMLIDQHAREGDEGRPEAVKPSKRVTFDVVE